jgi:hypothetical protein
MIGHVLKDQWSLSDCPFSDSLHDELGNTHNVGALFMIDVVIVNRIEGKTCGVKSSQEYTIDFVIFAVAIQGVNITRQGRDDDE